MDESRKRVSAVIIKENQLLLIRRTKPDEEYFVFPGGSVEEGEDLETALRREIKEELDIEVVKHETFLSLGDNHFFLIREYHGIPQIGLHGPEREYMSEQNQYHIEWIPIFNIEKMENIFPREVLAKIIEKVSREER